MERDRDFRADARIMRTRTRSSKKWSVGAVASSPVPSHPLWATESINTLSFSVGMITPFAGSAGMECGESLKKNQSGGESWRLSKDVKTAANIQRDIKATARQTSTPNTCKLKPLCALLGSAVAARDLRPRDSPCMLRRLSLRASLARAA